MTTIIRYISVLTALIFFSLPVRADLYSYITRSEGKPTNIDYFYTISAWTPPLRGSAHRVKSPGCPANAMPILTTGMSTATRAELQVVMTKHSTSAAVIWI